MGTWLLMLACSGDPMSCNTVLGLWQEVRFGSEARCMVEGGQYRQRGSANKYW
jgi:hypothetical protein